MPATPRKKTASRKPPPLRRIRALPKLPRRNRDGHKGDYGRVLVVGGSRGMIGAPALAANAALCSGAGLVTVACPWSIQQAVATLCPCATSIPLPENAAGIIDPRRACTELRANGQLDQAAAPSVVAAGPGRGRGNQAVDRAWLALLDAFGVACVPVVIDADGLNAMHRAADWTGPGWDKSPHFRTVITPHPGEMARLHDTTTAAVQQDREAFATNTARQMSSCGTEHVARSGGTDASNCGTGVSPVTDHEQQTRTVVVLKGAGTLVTDGHSIYTNKTGNPGMATGGSGDVLTGIIAALIAQGLSTLDAAILGTHIHGRAGDLAARELGEVSLTATDLIDHLPEAFTAMP